MTAIAISVLATVFYAAGARAAMRLPEDALSAEPWLLPANTPPAVMQVALFQAAPIPDVQRRIAGPVPFKATADRSRRRSNYQNDKRVLADLMGLTTGDSVDKGELPFFALQTCRVYVAVNC